MGRPHRVDVGNTVYHIINRANGRTQIFNTDADYRDFEDLLNEIRETYDIRILAYIIMPNHWHLLLYPLRDGSLSKALQWLGTTHARRYRTKTGTVGYGHLYQDRYKSFVITEDRHLLSVLKYIERNAVRAKLCDKTETWKWGSAYRRNATDRKARLLLSESPVPLPRDYMEWINTPEPAEELKAIHHSVNKGVRLEY